MYFERGDDDMESSKRRSVLLSLMFKCFIKPYVIEIFMMIKQNKFNICVFT